MVPNGGQCPVDLEDTAERYCMDTLPALDRAAFERHIESCAACARALRTTKDYIDAMRAAARQIRSGE